MCCSLIYNQCETAELEEWHTFELKRQRKKRKEKASNTELHSEILIPCVALLLLLLLSWYLLWRNRRSSRGQQNTTGDSLCTYIYIRKCGEPRKSFTHKTYTPHKYIGNMSVLQSTLCRMSMIERERTAKKVKPSITTFNKYTTGSGTGNGH